MHVDLIDKMFDDSSRLFEHSVNAIEESSKKTYKDTITASELKAMTPKTMAGHIAAIESDLDTGNLPDGVSKADARNTIKKLKDELKKKDYKLGKDYEVIKIGEGKVPNYDDNETETIKKLTENEDLPQTIFNKFRDLVEEDGLTEEDAIEQLSTEENMTVDDINELIDEFLDTVDEAKKKTNEARIVVSYGSEDAREWLENLANKYYMRVKASFLGDTAYFDGNPADLDRVANDVAANVHGLDVEVVEDLEEAKKKKELKIVGTDKTSKCKTIKDNRASYRVSKALKDGKVPAYDDNETEAIKKLTEGDDEDIEEPEIEVPDEAEPEDSKKELIDNDEDKFYFGKQDDTFYYLVTNDEGTTFKIVDQSDNEIFTDKDGQFTGVVDFIVAALQELNVAEIAIDVFNTYILPEITTVEEEQEEAEDDIEDMNEEEPIDDTPVEDEKPVESIKIKEGSKDAMREFIAEIIQHLEDELAAAANGRSDDWLEGFNYATDIVKQYKIIESKQKIKESSYRVLVPEKEKYSAVVKMLKDKGAKNVYANKVQGQVEISFELDKANFDGIDKVSNVLADIKKSTKFKVVRQSK